MAVRIDYVISFTFTEEQLPALRAEAQRRFDSATEEEREQYGFDKVQFDVSNIRHCAEMLLGEPDDFIGGREIEYQEASWGIAGLSEVEASSGAR